jgi:hypothetical protein
MAVRARVNLLLRLKTVGLVSRRGVFRSIAALYNDFEMRTVVLHQFAIQVVTICYHSAYRVVTNRLIAAHDGLPRRHIACTY